MIRYIFIGYLFGIILHPIISRHANLMVYKFTGKTMAELGFEAGRYTREKILNLPPLDYERSEDER